MREDFLMMVKSWKDMDVTTSPAFVTHKALYEAMMKRLGNREDAGRLAGCVEIDVSQSFVDDKELFNTIVDGYADLLCRTYNAFMAVSPVMFWTRMQKQGLSLKYND